MNHDEFEANLQRQPLRQPPPEWRAEILLHLPAVAADARRRTASGSAWKRRLHELFWPHPIAWGVIASVWVTIAILNAHSVPSDPQPVVSAPGTVRVVWQTVLLSEELWQDAPSIPPVPKRSPGTNSQPAPRSESIEKWRMI